ncbi:MAG: chorismate synthase [Bacteroidales bacterium]|nr:chorismate synthase [Bacteroidales bacterium]
MNSFGRIFRLHIFGESHGTHVGICLDGVPPGIYLTQTDFDADIERRKPQAVGTTKRKEKDVPIILSGVFNNYTTGAPLTIVFTNEQHNASDYHNMTYHYRPGHSDFTTHVKYKGYNDFRGGGHFSGRLTLPIVAAGVVAKKIIKPIEISAKITSIGGTTTDFEDIIQSVVNENDSIGGIVQCVVSNVPVGLGEPFFDSLESLLAHAMFSIPGIKGIEFGSGFKLATMKGSEANDCFINEQGKTKTNHSGGIIGGISSGNDITFSVVVKPPSSIGKTQFSYHWATKKIEALTITGRHDACIALRVPIVVEALTACVLADCMLIQKSCG